MARLRLAKNRFTRRGSALVYTIDVSEPHRAAVGARVRRKSQGRACSRIPARYVHSSQNRSRDSRFNPRAQVKRIFNNNREDRMVHAEIGQPAFARFFELHQASGEGRGSIRLFLFVLYSRQLPVSDPPGIKENPDVCPYSNRRNGRGKSSVATRGRERERESSSMSYAICSVLLISDGHKSRSHFIRSVEIRTQTDRDRISRSFNFS